jgi:diguanylate cyclase (GGDEF)-like protein/PAS domain S-box-containing protein
MSTQLRQAWGVHTAVLKIAVSVIMLGVPAMILANMHLASTPDTLFANRDFMTAALLMLAICGATFMWFEIDSRTRAEKLIEDQSELLSQQSLIASTMDTMVVTVNAAGEGEWCNAGFTRVAGFKVSEIRGKPLSEILSGPRQMQTTELLDTAKIEGQGLRSERLLYTRDGETYWADINIQPLLNKAGVLAGYVVLMIETTDRKQQEQILERIAYYDALTGLPNRALLMQRLRNWSSQEAARPALIYIKFPRMASMRSTLGHAITDELALAIVRHLQEQLQEQQLLAKLSVSSYALLVPVKRPSVALAIAYALQEAMSKPYRVADREIHMVSSVGVAVLTDQDEDPVNLLRDAEIASQSVSTATIDEVVLFDVAMRQQLESRHRLETDLRRAIYFDTQQLAVVFQPIMDLRSNELVGFETLARWKHPERGWVPPDQFIGIAEETGMIVPLWNFVFAEACQHLMRWQNLRAKDQTPLFVSVNLSASQFFYPGLMRSVSVVMEMTKVDPAWIKFEITESGLMENAAAALQQMENLKSLGCSLAIDDFGTGYSSLSYLQKLPVDDIKIDRSFIMEMNRSGGSREIVRIVTELGRILGKRVIAEGIETEYDLHVLRQLHCDYGQGYFFHRPLMPKDAEDVVKAQSQQQNFMLGA